MSKSTPAAEAFASLGIDPAEYTDTMRLAIKQKWSNLPIDAKVADLRAELAAVHVAELPDLPAIKADLIASGKSPVTDEDVDAEQKRLRRNAAVQAWRQRSQLQAALDARELKFAHLRAKRAAKPAADAQPMADAS